MLFLSNLVQNNYFDDFSIITKLFQVLNYCAIDVYLPNYYLCINENDLTIESKIEFSIYLQLCLCDHVKHCVNTKNADVILNMVNFFIYYHLYGTNTQAQFANESLIYLNKLIGTDFSTTLNKYYLNIYENTTNLLIKQLLIKNFQSSNQIFTQTFDFMIKNNNMYPNSKSLLFNFMLLNLTQQQRQQYQSHISKHILSIQNQFLDCLNLFFNEQQAINTKLIQRFLLCMKHFEALFVFESCPQSMHKFTEIYVKLIKLLKLFNINKFKSTFSLMAKFLCKIIHLLKLYNLNNRHLSQVLNNKLILFQLNFMQQLNIFIETTTSISTTKQNGYLYLKTVKFYSIDYIQSLSKFSSFETFNSELNDDDFIDSNEQIVSNEKQIIDKLVTYFCYLLNDSNCFIVQLTLECLNEFCEQSKYFDFILAEIIRSNKLRMQDLVGNYLRKIPKKCLLNDNEILSARLNKLIENNNITDDDENVEINVDQFENDANIMIKLYLNLNKPVWFKNKLENVIKILNQTV